MHKLQKPCDSKQKILDAFDKCRKALYDNMQETTNAYHKICDKFLVDIDRIITHADTETNKTKKT
jgi:hypothetical protein